MQPDTATVHSVLAGVGVTPESVEEAHAVGVVCRVRAEEARTTLAALGTCDMAFEFLVDLFGVDTGEAVDVVYRLRSFVRDLEITVKAAHPYDGDLASVWKSHPAALMPERECAEMFGLTLSGHPNPKHLLLTEGSPAYLLKSVEIRTAEEVRNR